ncbi:MAG: polysaccharide biosynthesis/export family protein [Deltaproteobacteria bacterium]
MRYVPFLALMLMLFTPAFAADKTNAYVIGIDDVLDINVLQPEKLTTTVAVAPDGSITFPYIGNVAAAGTTLDKLQQAIQDGLTNGYMKYPVVAVTLRESRSRKFFVYGEVMRPGTFPLEANTTVIRAITIAGGFNKFGSSHVKVLRPWKDKPGYQTLKINIKAAMDGAADKDIVIEPGDIVVVTEGIF